VSSGKGWFDSIEPWFEGERREAVTFSTARETVPSERFPFFPPAHAQILLPLFPLNQVD
jgi:hypothetical protein